MDYHSGDSISIKQKRGKQRKVLDKKDMRKICLKVTYQNNNKNKK